MSSNPPKNIPPNAQAVPPTSFLNAVVKQLPSSQEKRGDDKLVRARKLTNEFQSVIAENDLRIIEDKITLAREKRVGLDSKSGISKFIQAREYRRASKDAYQYAKHASDRGRDEAQFHQSGTSSGPAHDHGLEDIYSRVLRTARSLHRCKLSCKDAFPSSGKKESEEWAKDVWYEACMREGVYPDLLCQGEEFVYSNMRFLTDIKTKIKHAVQSSYGFDTSRAPGSIGRNARRAQALLSRMTFIYRDLNFGGRPQYPYRHPIIQTVINLTWFQNKDDDGILFYNYFEPIPTEAITVALTVIECCIEEWSDGTWKQSNLSEERYKAIYLSHLNSLRDFYNHGQLQQGGNLLDQIQCDLLKEARVHAGAPPDPIRGHGRFPIATLDAALQEDPPCIRK